MRRYYSRRTHKILKLPALLIALGLIAAACAADSDEPAGSDEAAETEPADEATDTDAGEDTNTAEEPADTEGDESASANYYQDGDEIEIIVPFAPGGGTDVFAYFMAEKLQEGIAADVSVFVNNISEGPGIGGMNQYVRNRDADGYSFVASSNSTNLPFLLGNPAVQYDLANDVVALAGTFPNDRVWYAHGSTGIESADDLCDGGPGVVVPTITMTGGDIPYILALEVLGLDITVVDGHDGGAGRQQAFQQGEATLNHDSPAAWDAAEVMVDNGEAYRIFARGNVDANGEWVGSGFYPELPIEVEIYEDCHGEAPSGDLYDVYQAAVATSSFANILWFHADAPTEAREEILAVIAEFEAAPGFAEEAEPVFGENVILSHGPDFPDRMSERFALPPGLADWIWEWLEGYGVDDPR